MKNEKIVTSKIAHSLRLESFRTSAPLILAALILMFATSSLATAQTYTDLYNFCCKNGRNPNGILAQGQDGNLYGTTSRGVPKTTVSSSGSHQTGSSASYMLLTARLAD